MPTIPREFIDNYVDALAKISGDDGAVRKELEETLARIDWTQSVANVRNQLIEVMQAYCSGATDQAAILASAFYDGLRERTVGERLGAFAESGREPEATDGAIRAFVQDLVDGKGSQPVIDKCLERLDYETKKAAATCITRNAQRDPNKPRYARVPSGNETCDFCIMLASRGPVYRSAKSAGAVDHFHSSCRCQVVPMFNTYQTGPSRRASASMSVEGYDPDELYEQYVQQMLDPKFRDRVARGADRARGGVGGAVGHDTSHPLVWARAKKEGRVSFGSVGEIQESIKAVDTYEGLFELIDTLSTEWDDYALSEKYRLEIQTALRRRRNQLIRDNQPVM